MDENQKNDLFEPINETNGTGEAPQTPLPRSTGEAPAVNGYTITPEGGYYTRTGADVIQDEPFRRPERQEAGETPPRANDPVSPNTPPFRSPDPSPAYNPRPYAGTAPVSYPPRPVKRERKKYGAGVVILSALLAAVIGFSGSVLMNRFQNGKTETAGTAVTGDLQNVEITVKEDAASAAEAVAKKCTKSVVGIRTTTSVTNFFYGSSESTEEASGVIYSADGYIITNYHAIESAVESGSESRIDVYLNENTEKAYPAKVVGYRISSDLALLKIDAKGLTPVEIGDSSKLVVGQYVVTIGNPGGLEFIGSVTYGVISGLNRVVSTDSDVKLIQTDAAINPGNSGGALLDTSGRLVGINSSKIVSTEFEGMGFAIPVNTAVKQIKQIIENKNGTDAYVGISCSKKYTAEILGFYGFPAGAVVQSVDEGSPAEKAGIKRGDIITEYNGITVSSVARFEEQLSNCSPGDKVPFKLYRSGRYYSGTLTVGADNN